MSLIRWNPLGEVDALHNRIAQLFRDFPTMTDDDESTAIGWAPRVDICEQDGKLVVRADLPGIPREKIEVAVREHCLILRGERAYTKTSKEANAYRSERGYGKFFRSFSLPPNVDEDHVEAELSDGVLTVTMQQTKEAKSKAIPIRCPAGSKKM